MFLITFDFEHTYIKKWCHISGVECKSCEIGKCFFFNIFIFENKIQFGYDTIQNKHISHGASKEPDR